MHTAMAPPSSPAAIRPEAYSDSPVHFAVVSGDHPLLSRILSSLPSLSPPSSVLTVPDAIRQSDLAATISSLLDRRDGVPLRDTPLHLAVRLNLPSFASLLLSSGADPSLHNSDGWSPLHLSLSLRRPRSLSSLLLRHHRLSAWSHFRRRLPLLLSALRQIPDFYLELSFHFESPLIPFLTRAAPSDTFRIWKRHESVRADTSLSGFRARRADQTFLFLDGSLLVLNRDRRQVYDAFEGAESGAAEPDDDAIISDGCAFRPGLDVTAAELVGCTNWRRRERVEMVGEWKARVYEIHNVVFSFKTMRAVEVAEAETDEEVVPLELVEDEEEGFLVAEMPSRHSCYEPRRRTSVGREDMVESGRRRRSVDVAVPVKDRDRRVVVGKSKEKETVKQLKPMVWLTEDFPLKTEEFLPLLDILANKVKAVRRLRELLATKFPPGTFPVKVAIPIFPTIRVVITFTKFVYLQPAEQFFTLLSSPRHLSFPEEEKEEHPKAESGNHKSFWLKWNNNATPKTNAARSKPMSTSQVVDHADPFTIPSDYTWVSIKPRSQNMKKSKSRKGKVKET